MTLSIIVPVYKVEKYLRQCVDSVLMQTYQDWELILIDDGSPDRCGEICDEYAKKDTRIKVIHKSNEGVSAARNDGLDKASGEYITFIDSDDALATEDTLSDNIHLLQQMPDVDILQFPIYGEKAKYEHGQILATPQEILQSLNSFVFTGYLWGKIYKANLFKEIRIHTDCSLAEDTWCLLELIPQINKVYLSRKGGYIYNKNLESAVHNFNSRKCLDLYRMTEAFHITLRKYFSSDETIVVNHFFLTYQRLLDATIVNDDNIYRKDINELKKIIPPFNVVLRTSNITTKQKIWRILFAVIGIKSISKLYVNIVRIRLQFTQKCLRDKYNT